MVSRVDPTAADNGLMPAVCKRIKLPKQKNKEVVVFGKNEQKAIEKYIESSDNPNDIGILICLCTGIRIGELCALEWKNIDLKRGIISINGNVNKSAVEIYGAIPHFV